MCTAIAFHGKEFYFGRTLDHGRSYGEEVVLAPRNFPLPFREAEDLPRHLAIMGMAHVENGYPLFYDAMNEAGLCMAGLNFTGFARYGHPGRDRIAPFEFLPWVLGRCDDLAQARELLLNFFLGPSSIVLHATIFALKKSARPANQFTAANLTL